MRNISQGNKFSTRTQQINSEGMSDYSILKLALWEFGGICYKHTYLEIGLGVIYHG